MNNAYNIFTQSVDNIKKFGYIYDKIRHDYPILATELDDMLRAQIVNIVSAMDCYIHDVVRIGIIESYLGNRTKTGKWKGSCITMDSAITLASIEAQYPINSPQKETDIINSLNIILKPILSTMSFQQSDKIKDALSYIWDKEHKMQEIASSINYPLIGANLNAKTKFLEQKLKLIVTRRNQIAHEADWDPSNRRKYSINKNEVDDIITFMERFVEAIHNKII